MDISLLSQSDFISVLEASRTQFKIVQQEWQDLYVDPITGEAFDMNDRKEVERLKTLFSPMQIKSKDMTLVELDSNSIKPVEPTMNELISSILSALGNNSLYYNDIRNEVMNKLNVSPEEVDKALDKLAQQGKIFEESRGVWKKI
jgi:DNA replicative helicase MCM subunit Mcm2 (Cdc46/Mcm family)